MRVIKLAMQQPITVAVGMILALLAGFVALDRVPVQMTPEVDDTVIAVTTTWENASPQEVESELIDEQEEKLQSVTNLRSMTSVSQRGQGQIRLEFTTGVNKEAALREVSDKLREVPSYPENVDEPIIEATDPESRDYIAWFIFTSTDPALDVRTLYDFLDDRVKPRLERLSGISEVGVLGGRERETQIRFDPVLLAQRQVTIPQFITALRATNRNFSAGALAQGKSDIRVRTLSQFSSPEQILNTVIRQDEAGPVYVRDVATVVETYKEPTSFVRVNGRPALAVNFTREPGANVIEVMRELKAEIQRLSEPGGMLESYAKSQGINGKLLFNQAYDQTEYIDQAIELVRSNIYVGGILATFVLLIFLRSLRSVGIIAIAIPISVVGAIVVMVALGRSINVISLAGMAFAVGMVVDNSIVVLENIFRHLEMGKSVIKATFDGASEVAGAVLASTLTTIVVFIPILLIQESSGQLFRDIALAICAAVGLSYLVSITVIPSAASLLLKVSRGRNEYSVKQEIDNGEPKVSLVKRFLRSLLIPIKTAASLVSNLPYALRQLVYWINGSWILRIAVVVVFVSITAIGTVLLLPPIDYLPQGNRNIVFGLMIPPPGYNLNQLSELGNRVEDRIRPFWEAGGGFFGDEQPRAGGTENLPAVPIAPIPNAPTVVPPPLSRYFLVGADGQMFHGGISEDPKRVVDIVPLFQSATSSEVLPGVLAFAFQFPLFRLGGSSGSAVKIDVVGPDLRNVSSSAVALYGRLVQQFGPYSLRPDPANFNLLAPELQIKPDLIRMSKLHLTVEDLALSVQTNGDGAIIGDYEIAGEFIDFKVISRNAVDQTTIIGLGDVPIATPMGSVVNLESVTQFNWVNAPETIKRVGRQRAVTLELTPPSGMPLQVAIDQIKAEIDQLRTANAILPGVEVNLAGTASKLDEIVRALLGDGSLMGTITSSLFLAFLVVYLLMCVLYQSWVYPFVIMFSVPLATFGGFLALSLVSAWSYADRYIPIQNMDVLTILGFVILAGVVVNNAILLVEQALNFLSGAEVSGADAQGSMTPRRAIALSVESRVRPIFMSMLTSVGGMLPLVLMPGSGSELYRGLGAVVVGGLLVSAIFTLVLVPALLSMVFDLKAAFGRTLTWEPVNVYGETKPDYGSKIKTDGAMANTHEKHLL